MKTILVYTLCSGVLVSSAMAEGEPRPDDERSDRREPRRERGDRHKPEHRELIFKKMDADGDGQISKDEFFAVEMTERVPEEKRDELYARLDRNKDGMISMREIEAMGKEQDEKRRREFRELDTDKNRGLSFEEFSKGRFFSKLPEEKRREIFNRMDTDKSGEITPEDHPGPRPPRGREPRGERGGEPDPE
ncbi:EF-hand domain-containing protein [Luteolibacter sp. AS25]|uniref:EF-hand domain-containing protein n=1 Tax=Luteolibacter sp. AS25 TaxID=3135776 RepID=UPI00398B097F